ncbi:MAG TPA: hypothetical protein VIL55_10865 [Naasia sp.]
MDRGGAGRRTSRARRLAAGVATTVAAALLSACTPGPASPTPAASSGTAAGPAGVSVVVVQNRTDLAGRRMQIRVANDGSDPVTVTAARYTDPRFAQAAEWAGDTTVPAGTARDLPVPIPPADCGGTAAGGIVELTYAAADGGSGVLEIEPTDPFDMVATVTAAECATAAVQEAAAITLVDELRFEGSGSAEVAILTVRVAVRGSEPVTIDEVQGTVLLQPDDGTITWPIAGTTEPGTTRDFPLRVVASRCDPHVVAEDKVGTLLPVLVTVGDGEQAQIILAASTEQRAQFYDYVGRSCGWG